VNQRHVELSRFVHRAKTVENQRGSFSTVDIITQEEIATLREASDIIMALATLAEAQIPRKVLIALVGNASGVLAIADELDNPDQNWKG
jgi:hypothetical protein